MCRSQQRPIPLEIDMSAVKVSIGDFEVDSIAETLEPYLPQIAEAIRLHASARKTVVFCPLISIAQELAGMIPGAREVNGGSADRKETLEWFDKAGPGAVLCNAMLLTEGWDCPSCDCVVVSEADEDQKPVLPDDRTRNKAVPRQGKSARSGFPLDVVQAQSLQTRVAGIGQ